MILNDKTIPSDSTRSDPTPPVPHPLDVATLEQLPDMLRAFWSEYRRKNGLGYSQATLNAAARAHARLHDHRRFLERRNQPGQPGSLRVLAGVTGLLIGSSLERSDDPSSWLLSAGLICLGLASVIWGVRAAHVNAVMDAPALTPALEPTPAIEPIPEGPVNQ